MRINQVHFHLMLKFKVVFALIQYTCTLHITIPKIITHSHTYINIHFTLSLVLWYRLRSVKIKPLCSIDV